MIILILLVVFFLINPIRQRKKKKEAKVKEGIVIRWKDRDGKWNFIPKERNMVMGWGKVKVWDNGDVEFIPESDRERLYREEPLYPFNPYMPSSWRLLNSLKRRMDMEVYWADGTDRYPSPKTFKILMEDENG